RATPRKTPMRATSPTLAGQNDPTPECERRESPYSNMQAKELADCLPVLRWKQLDEMESLNPILAAFKLDQQDKYAKKYQGALDEFEKAFEEYWLHRRRALIESALLNESLVCRIDLLA